MHPAAACPFRELLSLPQAGAGAGIGGGSVALGFREGSTETPTGIHPHQNLVLANHAYSAYIYSECCSSQKPYLWWSLLLPS